MTILDVSIACFEEIEMKLRAAGHEAQVQTVDGRHVIDLSGLAIRADPLDA